MKWRRHMEAVRCVDADRRYNSGRSQRCGWNLQKLASLQDERQAPTEVRNRKSLQATIAGPSAIEPVYFSGDHCAHQDVVEHAHHRQSHIKTVAENRIY